MNYPARLPLGSQTIIYQDIATTNKMTTRAAAAAAPL